MALQAKKEKKPTLTLEEKLENAIIADWEQPYPLPENWVWTRLGSVSELITGSTPSKQNPLYYGGDIPFYKPENLNQERHMFIASEYLSQDGYNISRKIRSGATCVCCIGSIGKSAYVEKEGTTNQQINSIDFYFNDLFLYYYTCTLSFITELQARASATTISIVNKSKFAETSLPLPPLAEQERIVTRIESLFAKLDEAKELAESALEKYENRKSAILHQAFTGELTANWRKENNVSMDSWEEKSVGDFAEIKGGKRLPSGHSLTETKTDFPYIRVTDFGDEDIEVDNLKYILPETYKQISRYIINKKDVYISIAGTIGKVGIIQDFLDNANLTENAAKIVLSSQVFNRFLLFALKTVSSKKQIKDFTKNSSQPKLALFRIAEIKINLPTLPEQKEIVRIIDSLFEKEDKAKECYAIITQIELMKKAILGRAFRGELGTNIPEEESAKNLLKEVLESKEQEIATKKEKKVQITIPKEVKILFKTSLEEKIYKVILEKKKCSIDDLINITKDSISVLQSLDRLEQETIIKKQDDYYMI